MAVDEIRIPLEDVTDVLMSSKKEKKRSLLSRIMFGCISYSKIKAHPFKRPALLEAFREQNLSRMRSILKNGVDISIKNMFLHHAVSIQALEIIQLFLDSGADIDYKYGGKTVLCKAINQQNIELVTLLLKNGANPKIDSNIRLSALYLATIDLNIDICKLLLQYGANITHSDIMLLYYVIQNKHRSLVELFVKNGPGVNFCSNDQIPTPLHHAVCTSTREIVHLLLENGAEVNVVNELKQSALFMLNNAEKGIIDLLLQYEANVNVRDVCSRTPLHFSVLDGKAENVETLLEYGANVNAVDDDGDSPLHYAVEVEDISISLLLLKHEADINCVNNIGMSPLCRSVQKESVTKNIFLSHAILLKVINRYINPINLNCLHDQMNNVHVKKRILMCGIEIQRMKNEKLTKDYYISLYDIVSKPLNLVAQYVKNEEIRIQLETIDYEKRFPIYSYFISSCIKKSIKKAELLIESYNILTFILNHVCLLPMTCVLNIIKYFNDKDMKELINIRM